MIALTLLAVAVADVSAPSPGVYGPGNLPCEVALKPENTQRVGDYVTGVWSGMNMAAATPGIGHSTDARGILLEVLLACHAAPKLPLALAALGVHMRFERQRR